jgi:hypothetical protein
MKLLLVLQILCGLVTIALSLFIMLPNVHAVREEPADISMIIGALNGESPTPQQIQRAATILTNQKRSLETTTSTIEISSKAFIYQGLVLVFFGIVILVDYVRRDKEKSLSSDKDPSAIG